MRRPNTGRSTVLSFAGIEVHAEGTMGFIAGALMERLQGMGGGMLRLQNKTPL